jgi:hypothetical protein
MEDDLSQHRMRLQRPRCCARAVDGSRCRQNDDLCRPGREIVRKPDRDLVIVRDSDVQLVCMHGDRRHLTRERRAGHPCVGAPSGAAWLRGRIQNDILKE